MSPPSQPSSRRLLFTAVTLLLAGSLVEGISALALAVVGEGSAMAVAEAAAAPGPERSPAEMPRHIASQVVHPYLGFVFDPRHPATRDLLERSGWVLSDLGFPQDPVMPRPAPDGAVTVGVFGGSVGAIFAAMGRMLKDDLERSGVFGDRPVIIRGYAMPGFKQPQQLMTLAWLATLDRVPDVVVNLDGFNDVALPLAENLPQGVHPAYPRGWAQRVSTVPDLELENLRGELAFLRHRRSSGEARFTASPASASRTARLLWRFHDQLLAARAVEVEESLRTRAEAPPGMLSRGPEWPPSGREASLAFLTEVWRRSSLAMDDLCAGFGCTYFHFLQPNQYVDGSKPLSNSERAAAWREDHPYRPGVVEGYPRLRVAGEELRQAGVRFTDLTRVFATTERTLYVDDCCHFNWTGNGILAAVIAQVISEEMSARAVPLRPPLAAERVH